MGIQQCGQHAEEKFLWNKRFTYFEDIIKKEMERDTKFQCNISIQLKKFYKKQIFSSTLLKNC